jgi:cobyrinic acid a,c-diamide synthase
VLVVVVPDRHRRSGLRAVPLDIEVVVRGRLDGRRLEVEQRHVGLAVASDLNPMNVSPAEVAEVWTLSQ